MATAVATVVATPAPGAPIAAVATLSPSAVVTVAATPMGDPQMVLQEAPPAGMSYISTQNLPPTAQTDDFSCALTLQLPTLWLRRQLSKMWTSMLRVALNRPRLHQVQLQIEAVRLPKRFYGGGDSNKRAALFPPPSFRRGSYGGCSRRSQSTGNPTSRVSVSPNAAQRGTRPSEPVRLENTGRLVPREDRRCDPLVHFPDLSRAWP
jgi:hypothetical protein